MRRLRQKARYDDGFTMVEVIVAMVIILIGVLGTLVLIDRANTTTTEAKTRQTANNILRDLLDTAQGLPYSSLTPTGLVPALQTRGFADSIPATTGTWDITRNGTTFAVTASVCVVDDPHDGSQNSHPSSSNFCADSPAGTGDSNGDDYRRVTMTINPPASVGAPITGATVVGQNRTTNIGGTGSGSGSSSIDITSMKIDTSAGKTTLYSGQVARCPGSFLSSSCPAGIYGNGPTASTVWPKQVYFVATTASTAQKMKFSVDGKVFATVNGPATTFNATWTLPDGQPDGTYTVSAQVYDSSGNTALSDPKPVTTILNRYLPDPLAFAATAAGRNHLYPQGTTGFGYPETETYPSNSGARLDRDIVGFQTLRYVGTASGVLACSTNSVLARSCQDTGAPVRSSTALKYRIIPYALNADGTQQLGNGNPPTSIDVNLANARPCAPRNLTATRSGAVVTLNWQAPAVTTTPNCPAGGDPDTTSGSSTTQPDCIDFYRVYTRAGGSTAFGFGDRADRTPFGVVSPSCGAAGEVSTSITLWETDSAPKSYQLTSVDTRLDESLPVTPTGCGSSC